jgi:hypothetical protein
MLRIFSPEKSDGLGRAWTRELGYQRPLIYHTEWRSVGACSEFKIQRLLEVGSFYLEDKVRSESRCTLRLRYVESGCQYRSCRWSVLLFQCIQLLNSGCSAIPFPIQSNSGARIQTSGSWKTNPLLWISAQPLSERCVLFSVLRKTGLGPGSSVGIATDYGLDGPGIESR